MRKLLVLLMVLMAQFSMSNAQLSSTPPIGTWEGQGALIYDAIDMNVSYKRVRVVVTSDQFRVTEWVRGTRDLPGAGLNCEMHLRNEWACKYVWEDGNMMRVTRIVQNPKAKIEKFTLGGDANTLKLLKQQGVTADSYRPAMEQSMNSSSVTFDVTGILVRDRKPDEFVFSYEGVKNVTLKRVVEAKKDTAPKTETKTEAKDDKTSVKPAETAANAEKPAAEAQEAPKPELQPADSVATAEPEPPVVEAKPVVANDKKDEVKPAEKPVEAKPEVKEEKAWYTEAWETFLSWF